MKNTAAGIETKILVEDIISGQIDLETKTRQELVDLDTRLKQNSQGVKDFTAYTLSEHFWSFASMGINTTENEIKRIEAHGQVIRTLKAVDQQIDLNTKIAKVAQAYGDDFASKLGGALKILGMQPQ